MGPQKHAHTPTHFTTLHDKKCTPSYYKLSAEFIWRTKPNPLNITIFVDDYFIVPGLRALAYLVTTTETNYSFIAIL
jgi:hypothetical protein